MNTRPRARTSSSSAHPFLKGGENRCHFHGWSIPYFKVGRLRRRPSDLERWHVDRMQVAPPLPGGMSYWSMEIVG